MKERTESELRDLREAAQYVRVYTRPTGSEEVQLPDYTEGCFSCRHGTSRLKPESVYRSMFVRAIRESDIDEDGDPVFESHLVTSFLMCMNDKAWSSGVGNQWNQTLMVPAAGPSKQKQWPRAQVWYKTWSQLRDGHDSLYVRQYRQGTGPVQRHVNQRVNWETLMNPLVYEQDPASWDYQLITQMNYGPGIYLELDSAPSSTGAITRSTLRISDKATARQFATNYIANASKNIQLQEVRPLGGQRKSGRKGMESYT